MASAAARPAALARVEAPGRASVRALRPEELAWIAAVPCALVTVAAVVLLGPLLGRALLTPGAEGFWPTIYAWPQPLEHGRFLVGLAGAPLLAAIVLASAHPRLRGRPRLSPTLIRALVATSQATLLAFVVVCFGAQHNIVLSADFPYSPHAIYFTLPTLVVALVAPPLALLLARRSPPGARVAALLRDTPARRRACLALAALYTLLWMLTAVDLDSSIGTTIEAVSGHILWTLPEPFAVLDGRTPLVDYHAQYGQLWAYLAAVPMALLGATIGTYTIFMATCSGLTMLAVYGVFRRLVRSPLLALALFLPFLATAFFMIVGPPSNRYGPENIFILWPIRYAGPFLLAWLTARHIDRAAPRRAWLVFALGGLVVVNNPEFGLGAVVATLAALVAAAPTRSWRIAGRLAATAAGGVLAAVALFSLFTLLRSGSLPRFGLLLEFSHLYGIGGWAQLPMPEVGLHLAVFLTFVATLLVAVVRVVRGDDREPLLTGLLAWGGVFGLVSALYYVGRAHPMALFDFFAPWAFTVVLLLLVVVRALAARSWRRPTAPELAVLFAFGLVACSLPQTPTPWSQIRRIADDTPVPVFKQLPAEQLIRETTRRGQKVMILTTLSHRIAYDLGLVNVSPYSSIESIATHRQLRETVAIARREGIHVLYVSMVFTRPEAFALLHQLGYVGGRYDATRAYRELLDRSGRAR